jgi:hypothetical protein
MTAYEQFFSSPVAGYLPATIPVITDEGHIGMATKSFDLSVNPAASAMAYSADPRERAQAALHAILAVNESLSEEVRHR